VKRLDRILNFALRWLALKIVMRQKKRGWKMWEHVDPMRSTIHFAIDPKPGGVKPQEIEQPTFWRDLNP